MFSNDVFNPCSKTIYENQFTKPVNALRSNEFHVLELLFLFLETIILICNNMLYTSRLYLNWYFLVFFNWNHLIRTDSVQDWNLKQIPTLINSTIIGRVHTQDRISLPGKISSTIISPSKMLISLRLLSLTELSSKQGISGAR